MILKLRGRDADRRWTGILAVAVFVLTVRATTIPLSLADGLEGVRWSAGRSDFLRAVPGLSCAPIACRGTWSFHGVPGRLDLVWGGFSPVITSSTFRFERSQLRRVKRLLQHELGSPGRDSIEDGDLLTEWKVHGTLIDLDHGSATEKPQLYIEPRRSR